MDLETLGPDSLRAFRSEFGLTKAALAERLGCALRTLEDWEAARRQPPAMLGVALAAVGRGLEAWRPRPVLGPSPSAADVDLVVKMLFHELADSRLVDLDDRFQRCLGPEAAPAERLLLAYMMDMSDGYNRVDALEDWSSRPANGWSTVVAFRPELDGATPAFGFETRYNRAAKQLAVFVDSHRPGERLPEKLRIETALVARGVRVISLSVNDILVNGTAARETIETVLSELADEVLFDAGKISQPWKRRDHR